MKMLAENISCAIIWFSIENYAGSQLNINEGE